MTIRSDERRDRPFSRSRSAPGDPRHLRHLPRRLLAEGLRPDAKARPQAGPDPEGGSEAEATQASTAACAAADSAAVATTNVAAAIATRGAASSTPSDPAQRRCPLGQQIPPRTLAHADGRAPSQYRVPCGRRGPQSRRRPRTAAEQEHSLWLRNRRGPASRELNARLSSGKVAWGGIAPGDRPARQFRTAPAARGRGTHAAARSCPEDCDAAL